MVVVRSPRPTTRPPSAASAGEAGNNDVEHGGDAVDDGTEDLSYAVDDGHEAVSDGAEDSLDLLEIRLAVCIGSGRAMPVAMGWEGARGERYGWRGRTYARHDSAHFG